MDKFDEIKIGDCAEFTHKITEKDIDVFSRLTGDTNPLHMDKEFAARTNFRKRVAHGMLSASFISTMVGTKLPGEGALWYEQHLKFLAPVRIDDEIRVFAKVIHKSQGQRIIVLETIIYNSHGKKVIEGEAKVKVIKTTENRYEEAMRKNSSADSSSGKKVIKGEARVKVIKATENRYEEAMRKNGSADSSKGAVIVTGASRGIGAATALKLAIEGYAVVVNYRNNEIAAQDIVKKIQSIDGRSSCFKADVTQGNEIERLVESAIDNFDTLEGVVNNASASINHISFDDMSWDDIRLHLNVQIKGAFNLCKSILPHFIENKAGIIVNIASIYADNVPPINMLHYNLAKSALVSMTKSLAVEYGPKGIRVNCVSPGMTVTDMIADIPEKAKMVAKMTTPLRRLAQPQDVASVVAFLFGEGGKHLCGETIRVCGGQVMQ